MTHRIRKRKLINSSLQLKLITTFLLVACVASLFQVLLLNRSLLSLARSMDSNGEVVLAQMPEMLFNNLLLTMVVLIPVMLVVGTLVTHRVAGPLYRFERHFESIADGEEVRPCKIRKGDELQGLCSKINAAVDRLQLEAGDAKQESNLHSLAGAHDREAA